MERTEEEILLEESIEVTLCGKTYTVWPLKCDRAIAWRKAGAQLAGDIIPAFTGADQNGGGVDVIAKVLPAVFVDGIEAMIEMMYLHSPELEADRDTIKASATHAEEVGAAIRVFKLSLPLFQTIAAEITEVIAAMGLEGKIADFRQSSKSS
jgi:hypothetical protein